MIWREADVDAAAAEALANSTGLPAPLARALILRGVDSAAAADRFLRPRLSDLTNPLEIPGMAAAVERLWRAVESQEAVVIFGDYDVDGVTSCGLMIQVLSALGSVASPYLPNRMDEGYGLTAEAVDRCLADFRPKLILTVDCGTGAIEAVDRARALGIDVIVTDHHEAPGETAKPLALVNPKLGGNPGTRMLAGVGVAFNLCRALLDYGRARGNAACEAFDLLGYIDLVAMGTIADIVPLRGDNRILASHGLNCLNRRERVGLRALMEAAALNGRIGAYQVGFVLGPRMNAAGRISDAGTALELLLTDNPQRARRLAASLDADNRERKRIENEITRQADAQVNPGYDPATQFGIVVGSSGWHQGVIGIVASRLCQRLQRPAVVVSFDENGLGRGSCRSVEGFDLVAGLERCADLLDDHGGHNKAAGLSVRRENIALFRERFNAVCRDRLANRDLSAALSLDGWLDLGEALKPEVIEGLDAMAPFGEGNPEPLWGFHGVRVVGQPRIVGETHIKLMLAAGGHMCDAIGFNLAGRPLPDGPLDVAGVLCRNNYLGRETIQIQIKDFRPAG